MDKWSKIRKWANRDDGRFYRVGNEDINGITVVGMLALVGALILGQLHAKSGISAAWAVVSGVLGVVLLFKGLASGGGKDT